MSILGKKYEVVISDICYWQVAKTCLGNHNDSTSHLKAAETETSFQVFSFRVIVGVLLKGLVKHAITWRILTHSSPSSVSKEKTT